MYVFSSFINTFWYSEVWRRRLEFRSISIFASTDSNSTTTRTGSGLLKTVLTALALLLILLTFLTLVSGIPISEDSFLTNSSSLSGSTRLASGIATITLLALSYLFFISFAMVVIITTAFSSL